MAEYQYLTETGVILPDTAETLEVVRNEFRTAFGNDLDVSAETPQGVLITGEVLARDAFLRNNADVANQINPNIAGGVFLDAIWGITGGQRFKATPTFVRNVTLAGVPSTIIPSGAIASVGPSGAQFQLISPVVLANDGTGLGNFQSVDLGAIAVNVSELNQIVTGVLGWETVSNPYAGDTGQPEESDIAARIRRRVTLALQGVALSEAIVSGVNALPAVRSMAFRENPTSAPVVIDGQNLVAHSVFVCVDGGLDTDIGLMLLRKKSSGAAWNGNTTVQVTEPYSGQVYDVKFSRPDEVLVYMQVYVRAGAPYADVPTTVRDAILAYADGEQEGEDGFVVGGDVSAFEIAGAVNRAAAPIYVTNLLLSTDGITYSTTTIPITIGQIATTLAGNIGVTVVP